MTATESKGKGRLMLHGGSRGDKERERAGAVLGPAAGENGFVLQDEKIIGQRG